MYHKFNANEILDMAVKIEKNGHEFYKEAAEKCSDADIKSFLLELADMEVKHEAYFNEMKAALSTAEKEEVVFDPYEETAAYLQALADTRVFYEKTIDMSSAKEVLKEAITAEKDSIVFYLGMKDMVSEDAGKKKIDTIIREEMNHIQIISNQLLKLQ